MVKEAESFAAEDHARREAAEARNQADQLAYTVDKQVADWGDQAPAADKDELVQANDELKKLLGDAASDTDALKAATEKVMGIFSRVGQTMHEQAQASGQAADASQETPEAAGSGDDEVVEGEIVEEGGSS